jgi:hypothetical protein
MIHEVDDAIGSLLRTEALPGTDVDVLFDAPTKDWAARRSGPTVNVYLYDIQENLGRRTMGHKRVAGDDGHVAAITQPPRFYRLAYLVTAWTQRPEDEHRLLSAVLAAVIKEDRLPVRYLTGSLADVTVPIEMTIALPAPDERSVADVWTALGGELKPSLDLVVMAPLVPGRAVETPFLVREVPRVGVRGADGEVEVAGGRRGNGDKDGGKDGDEDGDKAGGRRGKGGKGGRAATAQGEEPEPKPTADETRRAGATEAGRVIRVREIPT